MSIAVIDSSALLAVLLQESPDLSHLEDLFLQALLSAAGVIVILILGSIWIMNNLNYSMTNKVPSQSERSF